jgi:hypothetical protein
MSDQETSDVRNGSPDEDTSQQKRRGYKPMQEGYQPSEERGYTAVEGNRPGRPDSDSLPKPPKGGTGESNGSPSQGDSSS